jgi:ddrB-like ParB superfamily domain
LRVELVSQLRSRRRRKTAAATEAAARSDAALQAQWQRNVDAANNAIATHEGDALRAARRACCLNWTTCAICLGRRLGPPARLLGVRRCGLSSPNRARFLALAAERSIHSVAVAGGEQVNVRPWVVEAADVTASSGAAYDQSLQPRDRTGAASDAQVNDIAKNLNPEQLGRSTEADRGAPMSGLMAW